MTTWAQLREVIRSITSDIPDGDGNYKIEASILLRYTNHALHTISSRHSDTGVETLTVTNQSAVLPSGCVHVRHCYADGVELDPTVGNYPRESEYSPVSMTTLRVGDDSLTTVEIVYDKLWTELVDDADIVPVPLWLEEALTFYAASSALAHLASASGDLSQWDTKIDSGNPEHNPLLKLSDFYQKRADTSLMRYQ